MKKGLIFFIGILFFCLGKSLAQPPAGTCSYNFPNNFDSQINFNEIINCPDGNVILTNANDKSGNSTVTFSEDVNLESLIVEYKNGENPLEFIIPDGVTVTINTNLTFNVNSNPQDKFLTVEGSLIVGETLDFGDIEFEIDGTGTINAGSIIGASRTTCSTSGGGVATCPEVIAGSCEDGGGTAEFCTDDVSPVELIFFSAEAEKDNILLKWATATEENFDYFTIERSRNGRDYETLGTVDGKGWSYEVVNYSYNDNFPLQGKSYYRLKATDLDGTFEFFQPAMVNSSQSNKAVKLHANPVGSESVLFKLNFKPKSEINIVVSDLAGVEVYKTTYTPGQSTYSIDKTLDKGMYLLKVSADGSIYTTRFLKK